MHSSEDYNVYMYFDDELMEWNIYVVLPMLVINSKTPIIKAERRPVSSWRRSVLFTCLRMIIEGRGAAQEIRNRRKDAFTTNIVEELWNELFDLLSLPKDEMSDLLRRALNYLHSFWKQLFAYRNNEEYTIDNLAAERAIRPLTVQRKNSLFFGCTKGALNSAVYNTLIETCKQVGISFRDYFRMVLKELGSGREDYEKLLPMTIGIKQNN